jgi:hypothetical protein
MSDRNEPDEFDLKAAEIVYNAVTAKIAVEAAVAAWGRELHAELAKLREELDKGRLYDCHHCGARMRLAEVRQAETEKPSSSPSSSASSKF